MLSLLSQWKWALAGALTALVLLAVGGAYIKGRADGAAVTRAEALAKARAELIEQLNERNETDDAVESMSPDDLCRELGGVPAGGRCD